MITVSLIEDNEDDRKRLQRSMRSNKQIRLISAYATAEEAIERLPHAKSAVALVDIKLPTIDGIECVRRLRAIRPHCSPRFSKRQRADIFKSLLSDVRVRISQMEKPDRRAFHAAWRAATVHWLVCQNLIALSSKPKTVTPFSKNLGS